MGYVSDYFPRKVRPDKVGEYIAAIQQKTEWSQIEQDMHRADPDNVFTEEEKAHFVNNWLRGYVPNKTTLARPDNTKERKIDIIDPSLNMYYQDSIPTLLSYVGKMRHIIEAKKFFGLSASNPEAGIGTLVGGLVAQGKISPDQEVILKRLLRAVVQPQGVGSTAATWKNVGYIYTMGSPASAVTQIGDLAFSFHKNGFYRTMKGLTKSVFGQQEFKKEHIGIGNIAQEFEDTSTSSKAVQKVFKAIGIQFTDNVGKETYMGAAYDRLRSAAKKNGQQFKDQLSIIFGDQADQVQQDLIADNRTDDVLYLVASELYDVQPVAITEMPIGYARGGTHRIWYMLKSYTIKQIDTYRREIFTEIGSGEPKRMVKGMKNLVTLSTWMFLMGATSDFLKDLMMGRETEPEDLVYDNILKLAGISKFQIYRAKEAGVIESFVPPLLAPVVDLGSDVTGVLTDDKDIKDLEVWGHIPVLGKLYYWWYGAGAEKE